MRTLVPICVLALVAFAHAGDLQTIFNNIKNQKALDSGSVGSQLWNEISTGMKVEDISLWNITGKITSSPPTLTVTANGKIWDQAKVYITMFFEYHEKNLEMALTFIADDNLKNMYAHVYNRSAPPELNGIAGNDSLEVAFATASGLSVPQGIMISGSATVTNGTILEAAQVLQPKLKSLGPVSASIYFPVFSPNPQDFVLKITESGDIPVNQALTVNGISFEVDYPQGLDMSMVATLAAAGPNKTTESLKFSLSAAFSAGQKSATFKGDMSGDWYHPFGARWMNITDVDVTLKIGLGFDLTLNGMADLSYSNKPVSAIAEFGTSAGGSRLDDILISVSNIPLSKGITGWFKDTSGQTPPKLLTQIEQASGYASVSLSTFQSGSIREGVTLSADVKVTDSTSDLLKAVRILKHNATPKTFVYDLSLYLPVFTDATSLQFSLQESGSPFKIFDTLKATSFTIDVDLATTGSTIEIYTDVDITADKDVLEFKLMGEFQSTSDEVTFSGSLVKPWDHPFGLKWLDMTAGSITLTLGGSSVFDSLAIKGTGSLEFVPGSSVTMDVTIAGQQLGDVLFSITGIPIDTLTLGMMYMEITGATHIPPSLASLSPTGTAGMAITTFADNGFQPGVTLQGHVTLTDTGKIYQAARTLMNPGTSTYTMMFYLPVFSSQPLDVTIDLSYTGDFNLEKNIACLGYSIDASLSPTDTNIDLSTTLAVTVPKQSSPIKFSLSGDFAEASESVTFTGNLESPWDHPFGVSWLIMDQLAATLAVSATEGLQTLSMSGTGNFTFKNTWAQAGLSLSFDDDFEDITLSARVNNVWKFYEVCEEILGGTPSHWLQSVIVDSKFQLAFSISTMTGISVSAQGDVINPLLGRMNKISYWWADQKINDVTFAVQFALTWQGDIDLSLKYAESIPISKTITFESVTFGLDVATDSSISLMTQLKGKWKNNPPLYFNVGGAFTTDGSVLLKGDMIGTWVNGFGIQGFNLSNVILEFGLNPDNCAVDACISDIGIGFIMAIGHTTIQFDGNVAAPDWEDIFMKGAVSTTTDTADHKELTVLDVANDWNAIVPSAPVDTSLIPGSWHLDDASFWFATSDGTFGNIQYVAGFGITGGIVILDMQLYLSVNCTDGIGFVCNFAFDVDVTKQDFTKMIDNELGAVQNKSEFDIFKVNSVALSSWSQKKVAHDLNPEWLIDITVLNKRHELTPSVKQYELASSFHQFFEQWLSHLFN